jgi:hypothetical protein
VAAIGTLLLLAGCGDFTDPATRLASDLERTSHELAPDEGAHMTLVHRTPSARGECEGPYKVQLDAVGAIIVWCMDATGQTVSSHSTTFHSRFVDTARTIILDKPAGSPLQIELTRRSGRPTIVGAS